jgi:hypothetical protein
MPPTCRSLGVNSAKDYAPIPEGPFDDCGRPIGVLTDDRTPSAKLWAILPVLIQRRRSGNTNRHRRVADASTFGSVETEPHAGCQIQTVIGASYFPAKKPPPQIPR